VAERRSRGEGGLSWNESRKRWIGRVSAGFTAMGKRRIVTVSGRTQDGGEGQAAHGAARL
jgi:hypothetical protein